MNPSPHLIQTLQAVNLTAEDFNTTLDAMTSAADGTSWEIQKDAISFKLIKNGPDSYNLVTSKK